MTAVGWDEDEDGCAEPCCQPPPKPPAFFVQGLLYTDCPHDRAPGVDVQFRARLVEEIPDSGGLLVAFGYRWWSDDPVSKYPDTMDEYDFRRFRIDPEDGEKAP